MKKLVWSKVFLLLALCLIMLGASYYIFQKAMAEDGINRGLDIAGGVSILLEAEEEEDREVDQDAIDRSIAIIRTRIDELGVVEPSIRQEGSNRIRVELPGYEDERQAREVIGQTARLEFVDPDGEVILTGENLDDAGASREYAGGAMPEPVVTLGLDAEGQRIFEEETTRLQGEYISIYLDEELLSQPGVREVIQEGHDPFITGLEDMEEASNLAMMLRAGALPVPLEEQELRLEGPELGEDMEDVGIIAAGIGLLAVLLFLFVYYRAVGILAGVVLLFYLSLVLGALWGLGASLTVPGIAGIILSIGMAVDANIIIFERIKEELRSGRMLRVSIEAGFERAVKTILDANITTLIAAAVLFGFATGPVRGFAVTLSVGLVCSMITALLITRLMLRLGYRSGLLRSGSYLGVKI